MPVEEQKLGSSLSDTTKGLYRRMGKRIQVRRKVGFRLIAVLKRAPVSVQRCAAAPVVQGAGSTALLNRFILKAFSLRSNSRIGAVR